MPHGPWFHGLACQFANGPMMTDTLVLSQGILQRPTSKAAVACIPQPLPTAFSTAPAHLVRDRARA